MSTSPRETADFEARIRENLGKGIVRSEGVFISPDAHLSGHVILGSQANVWHGAVLRGDIAPVHVGEGTNIQDLVVLHVADHLPCRIGNWCTVGHSAIIHACTIHDECLIGMGAVILDGAEIGPQCLIGASALVTQRTKIPEGSLVLGSPARVVRPLTPAERAGIRLGAERYVILAREHQKHLESRQVNLFNGWVK